MFELNSNFELLQLINIALRVQRKELFLRKFKIHKKIQYPLTDLDTYFMEILIDSICSKAK